MPLFLTSYIILHKFWDIVLAELRDFSRNKLSPGQRTSMKGNIHKSRFITERGPLRVLNFEAHQHSKYLVRRRARLFRLEEEQKPPRGGCCINIYTGKGEELRARRRTEEGAGGPNEMQMP